MGTPVRPSTTTATLVMATVFRFVSLFLIVQVAAPTVLAPANATLNVSKFCPQSQDMNNEYGDVQFDANGWTFTGDARVSSKTSWNLLGGHIAFDMDVSAVAPEVNTNLYTSSMSQPNCGEACYCDIQKSPSGKPSCMEMDIIENNGRCAMATTIHTFATDGQPNNRNCDRWGCGSGMNIPSDGRFHIIAAFSMDGSMSVTLNGAPNNNFYPRPSQDSNSVVVKTMQTFGAAIESSQWFGWAPAESKCPSGSKDGLANSSLRISNVTVVGQVVQGPQPTKCTDQLL